jgi:hypothetical protein
MRYSIQSGILLAATLSPVVDAERVLIGCYRTLLRCDLHGGRIYTHPTHARHPQQETKLHYFTMRYSIQSGILLAATLSPVVDAERVLGAYIFGAISMAGEYIRTQHTLGIHNRRQSCSQQNARLDSCWLQLCLLLWMPSVCWVRIYSPAMEIAPQKCSVARLDRVPHGEIRKQRKETQAIKSPEVQPLCRFMSILRTYTYQFFPRSQA